MRVTGPESVKLLLRAGDGDSRELVADGEDRPRVYGPSVYGQSWTDDLASSHRAQGQSQTGATLDAFDGPGGRLSKAAAVGRRGRAQGVSVPFAECGNRASGPGLEHGYHVYSDADGVHVPDGGDGLAQSICAVVAAV